MLNSRGIPPTILNHIPELLEFGDMILQPVGVSRNIVNPNISQKPPYYAVLVTLNLRLPGVWIFLLWFVGDPAIVIHDHDPLVRRVRGIPLRPPHRPELHLNVIALVNVTALHLHLHLVVISIGDSRLLRELP